MAQRATTNQPQETPPPYAYEPDAPAPPNGTTRRARTQPAARYDPAAEAGLVGALAVGFPNARAAAAAIAPHHLWTPAWADALAAICSIHDRGEDVDPTTLAAEFRRTHRDDLAERAQDLYNQLNAAATPNAVACARIILEDAHHRALKGASTELAYALEHGDDPSRALELLDDARAQPATIDQTPDVDADAFLHDDEAEYDWAVPGLIEHGDRLILTGPEGKGKSTLFRQLAVQLACGIHPFGAADYDPLRVYLLDLENSSRQVRRKIRPIVISAGRSLKPEMLRIHCRTEGLNLADPTDQAWLENRIIVNQPDVLITGPIYKLADGDPDRETDTKPVVVFLDRMRARHGVTLLLEAHTPHDAKTERPVGWSGWKRWPEFGLYLADDGRIRHWRGPRDERDWPSLLRRGGEWPWTAETNSRAVTFAEMKAKVAELGFVPSNRELGRLLNIGEATIRRAVNNNSTEWSTHISSLSREEPE